ncbi:MAG: hypothetical protein WCS94_02325 [Verrucomicrobiota bacterium]
MKSKFIRYLTLVLSAGLCGCSTSSRDFHKWQSKAAQVTVGMTQDQVETILPQWIPRTELLGPPSISTTCGSGMSVWYWVSEYTTVSMYYSGSITNRVIRPVEVKKRLYVEAEYWGSKTNQIAKSKLRAFSGDAIQNVRDASRKLDESQISLEALPKKKTNAIVPPSLAFKKVRVEVPTRFKITRTNNVLTVALDANSLEKTNLITGENMVLGIEARLSVYFQMNGQIVFLNDQVYDLHWGTDFHFEPHKFEIPFSRIDTKYKTKYTVEADLNIFETDVQPQHLWNPQNGKYSVLWQQKLRHTFDE